MRNERGFTLLEILVATAIMGIAVAGMMSGLATSARNAARITQYDRAAMLARLKMDELLADDAVPLDRPVSGSYRPIDAGGVQAGWQARVVPFAAPTPELPPGTPVVERIELEIWWMDGPTRRRFTLVGIRRGTIPVEVSK